MKYWICVNTDCKQFEHVASANSQPNCPACKDPMNNLDEWGGSDGEAWTEEDIRDLPRSYV